MLATTENNINLKLVEINKKHKNLSEIKTNLLKNNTEIIKKTKYLGRIPYANISKKKGFMDFAKKMLDAI